MVVHAESIESLDFSKNYLKENKTMDNNIREKLEKWVRDNYKQYATGWTPERSEGNYYDCFGDGFTCATSWAAYEVGCILGMDLEEPDEPDDDED
jgi:hypothetical protein